MSKLEDEYDALPEYTTPYIGAEKYTGPYLSNGKFQTSVEFGDKTPASKLDTASRLHDSAYAKYKDRMHLQAADHIYERETEKIKGDFPKYAGDIVKYGNFAKRSFYNIYDNTVAGSYILPGIGTLAGMVYGGIKNIYQTYDWMMNSDKYIKDVENYYATDPYAGKMYNPYVRRNFKPDSIKIQPVVNKIVHVKNEEAKPVFHSRYIPKIKHRKLYRNRKHYYYG